MTTLANGILGRVGDEVAHLATSITVTGATEDADYPATNLIDGNPARVAKLQTAAMTPGAGNWIFDFNDVKTVVEIAAIIHHNLAGATVLIQGNDTNVWTSPGFSAVFVIPDWIGAGVRRWPVNPWLDLTEESGYDPAGFKFWRIAITDCEDDAIEVGEILFYSDRLTLDPDLRWGMDATNVRRLERPLVENITRYGVSTIYALGTQRWSAEGTIRADETLFASLQEHWQDAGGRELGFLLIPDGLVNVCYFVRYRAPIIELPNQFTNWHDLSFQVEEIARGLRPGS